MLLDCQENNHQTPLLAQDSSLPLLKRQREKQEQGEWMGDETVSFLLIWKQ